jgi:hypothetical protein
MPEPPKTNDDDELDESRPIADPKDGFVDWKVGYGPSYQLLDDA